MFCLHVCVRMRGDEGHFSSPLSYLSHSVSPNCLTHSQCLPLSYCPSHPVPSHLGWEPHASARTGLLRLTPPPVACEPYQRHLELIAAFTSFTAILISLLSYVREKKKTRMYLHCLYLEYTFENFYSDIKVLAIKLHLKRAFPTTK